MIQAAEASRGGGAKPWPVLSLKEVEARLCAPGAPFEMEVVDIDGVPTRCWKNQPPTLTALVRGTRSQFAKNTFLVLDADRVTYEGWFRAVSALAWALRERGVKKGDRVAIAMRNLPEFPVAFYAAASLGAIVTPLNGWWTGQELRYGLSDSGCSVLICDDERWRRIAPFRSELPELRHVLVARAADGEALGAVDRLEAVIGEPGAYGELPDRELPHTELWPEDPATIFYTSGTTGAPKGALGSHRNMLNCTLSSAYGARRSALRRGEEPKPAEPKVNLTVIPLFHVTACNSVLLGCMMSGGTLVFMHKWDTLEALGLIEREKVNTTGGVPTIAWQILQHPDRHRFDLSSLEAMYYGGAPSAPELVRRLDQDMNILPSNGWGMTETSAVVTLNTGEDYLHRPDSCGPPLPVSDLKIMSEDGMRELPVGEVGELWASGPQIVKGYWNKPEATAATFQNGWVRTGDLARLDGEGFCYIVDRAKDMIIRGGENIYSSEVENVLYDHPAVVDAALIGRPHPTLGEEPVAVVHLAPGALASEAELQRWVRERLAAFKCPVRVYFLGETLPRNANGKILKKELKAMVGAATSG